MHFAVTFFCTCRKHKSANNTLYPLVLLLFKRVYERKWWMKCGDGGVGGEIKKNTTRTEGKFNQYYSDELL